MGKESARADVDCQIFLAIALELHTTNMKGRNEYRKCKSCRRLPDYLAIAALLILECNYKKMIWKQKVKESARADFDCQLSQAIAALITSCNCEKISLDQTGSGKT